jgi:uncharacterized protein YdeI (YjbR/CyaY-like superfamily)
MPGTGSAIYFGSPAAFRRWLEANHAKASELLVGYWKRETGRPSLTWPESVDEALSFGWIDGVRRSVDERRYTIRFTPRRPGSSFSAVNLARIEKLQREGRLRPAGRAAFEARPVGDTRPRASYEQAKASRLTPAQERGFRANRRAWAYFQSQPPHYRRTCVFWVTSARRNETRARRLAALVRDSAAGRWVGPMRRPGAPSRRRGTPASEPGRRAPR